MPQGQSLQLEPWEYESGGYFFELSEFLTENLPHFEFALPFISQPEGKKVGREPWHISYLPLAEQASQLFTPDVLLQVWQHETVAGKETLIAHLPEIFEQYVEFNKNAASRCVFYGLINSFYSFPRIYVEFSHSCLWLGNIHQFVEQYKQNDVSPYNQWQW